MKLCWAAAGSRQIISRSEMGIVKWVPVVPSRETACLESYWIPIKDTKIQSWDPSAKGFINITDGKHFVKTVQKHDGSFQMKKAIFQVELL